MCRKAIFAAMKLIDQRATTTATDKPMTLRLGALPAPAALSALGSTDTGSGQPFRAHAEFLDAIEPGLVADSGTARNTNGALRRHGHFRLDDVFVPVTAASGDVAGQGEVGQG